MLQAVNVASKVFLRTILFFLGPASFYLSHCRCTGYCCLWSHTITHTRQDSPGRVIGHSQRPLPASLKNTQLTRDKHPRPWRGGGRVCFFLIPSLLLYLLLCSDYPGLCLCLYCTTHTHTHPCPRRDSNPKSQQSRLKVRGRWNRLVFCKLQKHNSRAPHGDIHSLGRRNLLHFCHNAWPWTSDLFGATRTSVSIQPLWISFT
jgi:hypothetical protein